MPWYLWAALAVGVLLIAVAAYSLDRMALAVVRPPRRPHRREPEDTRFDVQRITVAADHPLEGWWMRPAGWPRGPVVLFVHGWGANAVVFLELAEGLLEEGHEVVLFDVRNHGRSPEAPWVTLGQYVRDTEAALAHVRGHAPGRAVALVGHSMGGAASTVAAADDHGVAGVVLIAAPHDMHGTLIRYLRERGLPGAMMVRLLRPFWAPRLGRPARELDPGRRAPHVRSPVLVIQPEHDTRVPLEDGKALARDTGGRLLIVEGAGHSDVLQRREVGTAIGDFLLSPPVSGG